MPTVTPNLHHFFFTISLLDGKYDVWEWFGEFVSSPE
jgi:hypothetical protein